MKNAERDLQRACVKWFWMQYGREDGLLFASLNGVASTARQKSQWKYDGLLKGVPDLQLIYEGNTVFFELKRPKTYRISEKTGKTIVKDSGGILSKEQNDFINNCDTFGFGVYVVDCIDDFIEIVTKKLGVNGNGL